MHEANLKHFSTTISIFQITAIALSARLYIFAAFVLSLNETNGDSIGLVVRSYYQRSLR